MLSYEDLTAAQKKWVDLVEIHYPEVMLQDNVTYTDIKTFHTFFVQKRVENKKYKCSMPLWLITNNAISRGHYRFPGSLVIIGEEMVGLDDPMEKIYKEELKKFGIKGKK